MLSLAIDLNPSVAYLGIEPEPRDTRNTFQRFYRQFRRLNPICKLNCFGYIRLLQSSNPRLISSSDAGVSSFFELPAPAPDIQNSVIGYPALGKIYISENRNIFRKTEVCDMYLDRILGSKTKVNILSALTQNKEKSFMESELAKEIGSSISEVSRQIIDLVNVGLVRMERVGKAKIYPIFRST